MIQSSLWTFLFVLLIAGSTAIVFWGSLWKNVSDNPVVQGIVRFLPSKLQNFLREVSGYSDRRILAPSLMWAIVFDVFGIGLANLVLFRAFGQTIPFADFFAVIFIVNIVASIPVSVNNIGIKEWAYFTFFPMISVSPELAVTVAIAGRLVQMFISFLAFPDFLRRKQLGGSVENVS